MWYLVTTLTNSEAHEYQRKPSSIKQARRIRTEIHDLTGEIRQNNTARAANICRVHLSPSGNFNQRGAMPDVFCDFSCS